MVAMAEAGRKERTLGYIRYSKEAAGPGYITCRPNFDPSPAAGYLEDMARSTPGSGTDDSTLEEVLQQCCTHVLR